MFEREKLIFPLVATGMALFYSAGYFIGLDPQLFHIFSIAEHFIFALGALPAAFVFLILAFVAAQPIKHYNGWLKDVKDQSSREKVVTWIVYIGGVAILLFCFVYFFVPGFASLRKIFSDVGLAFLLLVDACERPA